MRQQSCESLLVHQPTNMRPSVRVESAGPKQLFLCPDRLQSRPRQRQLHAWNRNAGLGVVFDSSTGFRMPDGALLSPDASWVRRDRWDALSEAQREGFAPLCPDAVFEIASPSDRLEDLRAKVLAYLANGARLAVLISPQSRTVEVCRPGRDPEIHTTPQNVALDPELPGFVQDLGPIFAP